MSVFLTIDNGNSLTKAAVWVGEAIAGDIQRIATGADVEHLAAEHGKFDRVAISSVSDIDLSILDAAARLSRRSVIILDASTPMPVDISAYTTGNTLGADRIAALVGARGLTEGKEALVVDFGTAITYDFLSADGKFKGGVIAPGIVMRLKAMHAFTSRLPIVDPGMEYRSVGLNTAQAMLAGAVGGAVAELTYYRSMLPVGGLVVATGGAAPTVLRHVDFEAIVANDLVLHGLKDIIEYN